MYTNPVPRLSIPSVCTSDGPHGLRKQKNAKDNGVSESEPATSFPTAATTAASWNPENVYEMGKAIATECAHHEVDVLLGPGINIKRNPLCGRNFEYFSEDPLLAGKMGVAEVKGVQDNGVGVSVKHFAMNNTENYRFMGNSVADERTIREIYLKPFERVVKEAKPMTLMCAYNKINGTYCCENEWLLTDVLRKEWGFEGSVMSDWGASHNRVKGVASGLELEMPGDTAICRKWIVDAAKDGSLPMEKLDEGVFNILKLVEKCQENKKRQPIKKGGLTGERRDENHALAGKIAIDSAVLLRNDGMLPLKEIEKVLVVGELFEKMRYQGAGSSMIHPARLCTPKQAFDEKKIPYEYVKGYHENRIEPEQELASKAAQAAEKYDKIVVFAGLTDYVESEGGDRESMKLPENQLTLIEKLCSMNRNITIVLYGGSSIELPFADKVNAILDMYLPGQNGGLATRELLYGKANPSGRLAETWVKQYEDVPFGETFGKTDTEVYKESIYVGYRYYETVGKEVRYPFGYGLSYTTFAYNELEAYAEENGTYEVEICKNAHEVLWEDTVEVTCGVNVCSAAEKKTSGEAASAKESAEYIYRTASLPKVTDEVFEAMSDVKIPAKTPSMPITLESRFTDLKQTFMGRILFGAVLSVADKSEKEALKLPEGTEHDNKLKGAQFMRRILESNSVMTMSMSAGKTFPYNIAQGMVEMANGHLFRGLKAMASAPKAPKLPKEE